MQNKTLITAALPYANGPLHFGHMAGAYLPGDCFARFSRLQGDDVFYVCGSDEYGVAITLSAEKAGRTPKEHVEIFHKINQDLFKKLNISFDHYSRTTCKEHQKPVQEFFLDLLANGYIEEKVTDQLYSPEDDRFLADRYVTGECPKCSYAEARGDECPKCSASFEATDLKNPVSKVTGSSLILKPTKHWFLRFDLFKERLLEWLDKKDWKPNVINFVKQYVKDLKPRAITRDSNWGIPVPLDGAEGKVLYVWFDAPIGYISATIEAMGEKWKTYWESENTKLVNFIGKDNIPFHAIFFPAMCMGQNKPIKLVDDLPANEFLNLEGKQFSKSSNWYIDLEDFFKKFSTDQIRYTLAANAPETQDAEFTWKDFLMRVNAELVGKYGNLVNRVLVFAASNTEQKVPEMDNLLDVDQTFISEIDALLVKIKKSYSEYKVRGASQLIMELASLGNVYFNTKMPWKAEKESLETTVACCLHCLKALALASYPIIPETAKKLYGLLGYKEKLTTSNWEEIASASIPVGQRLPEPSVLFTKIEPKMIAEEEKKLQDGAVEENKSYTPLKEEITFDEISKVDLRVGVVIASEKIKKSNKLLKLRVDLGFEKRTIVAGIGKELKDPKDIIGKKVTIVANLKPAKLMGEISQGMLLAATDADGLVDLVAAKKSTPGTQIS